MGCKGCFKHRDRKVHLMAIQPQAGGGRWYRSRAGVTLLVFMAIAAFFLLTEHTAHVFGALPFLLILACPLMHLFMHGGHGGHDQHGEPQQKVER